MISEPVCEIDRAGIPYWSRHCRPAPLSPTIPAFGPGRQALAHHRPEHGGQEHLHPPSGAAANPAGPDRQLRACHSARLGVADRIFTRVGAGDELTRGQSTFMVEMAETANILNNATRAKPGHSRRDRPRHEHLRRPVAGLGDHRASSRRRSVAGRCLPPTTTNCTKLAELLPGVRNWNAAVHEEMGKIIFIHRIAPVQRTQFRYPRRPVSWGTKPGAGTSEAGAGRTGEQTYVSAGPGDGDGQAQA